MSEKKSIQYPIIDLLKGICAIWVIMIHAIPAGGGIYKLLLMPFYTQLTIPFFMMISGFTNTISIERQGAWLQWYAPANLWRKAKRILLPVIPVLLLELFVVGVPEHPMRWLLSGGYQMPGSYYVILMVQLIILFPLLYRAYTWWHETRKHTWKSGLVIVLVLQCLYELLTYGVDLPTSIYRLLIFRYGVFLYMGIVLYKLYTNNIYISKSLLKLMPLGFLFILAIGYLGWQPEILFRYDTWYRSSAPTIFWVAPLFALLLAYGDKILAALTSNKWLARLTQATTYAGRASYHIYLVQMLWFGLVVPHVDTSSWRKLVVFVVSVFVCGSLGGLYFWMGRKVKAFRKLKRS